MAFPDGAARDRRQARSRGEARSSRAHGSISISVTVRLKADTTYELHRHGPPKGGHYVRTFTTYVVSGFSRTVPASAGPFPGLSGPPEQPLERPAVDDAIDGHMREPGVRDRGLGIREVAGAMRVAVERKKTARSHGQA